MVFEKKAAMFEELTVVIGKIGKFWVDLGLETNPVGEESLFISFLSIYLSIHLSAYSCISVPPLRDTGLMRIRSKDTTEISKSITSRC